MKRSSSILVVAVILITATLTMMYANSQTQNGNRRVLNANRPTENANTQAASSESQANDNTKIRKGKMQVKRLPGGTEGVELKDGVVRLKPGYKFEKKDDGTVSVARMSGGLGETGGTWSCGCGSEGGGTCKANIVLGVLSCAAGTCKDCFLDVTVGKVKTTIMRY